MTVLMAISFGDRGGESTISTGGIELSLTREFTTATVKRSGFGDDTGSYAAGGQVAAPQAVGRYLVAVTDSEGLLHLTEFRFENPQQLLDACEEALNWFDSVRECIEEYVRSPTSQSIQSLTSTLN